PEKSHSRPPGSESPPIPLPAGNDNQIFHKKPAVPKFSSPQSRLALRQSPPVWRQQLFAAVSPAALPPVPFLCELPAKRRDKRPGYGECSGNCHPARNFPPRDLPPRQRPDGKESSSPAASPVSTQTRPSDTRV